MTKGVSVRLVVCVSDFVGAAARATPDVMARTVTMGISKILGQAACRRQLRWRGLIGTEAAAKSYFSTITCSASNLVSPVSIARGSKSPSSPGEDGEVILIASTR